MIFHNQKIDEIYDTKTVTFTFLYYWEGEGLLSCSLNNFFFILNKPSYRIVNC
jgi:hypothetical protein